MALKESVELSKTASDKLADKATYWSSVLKDWKASGLKQKIFCEKRAISYSQLGHWRTRLNRMQPSSQAQFIPVQLSKENPCSSGNLEVKLPTGVSLSIPSHYPEAMLSQVLTLLEVKAC